MMGDNIPSPLSKIIPKGLKGTMKSATPSPVRSYDDSDIKSRNSSAPAGPPPFASRVPVPTSREGRPQERSRSRGVDASGEGHQVRERSASLESKPSLNTVSQIPHEEMLKMLNWLDNLHLSKPKKNMCRDFSDGVLMAELIGYYFPKMIEIHNYAPANGPTLKKHNWELLNRKVLPKLGIKLPGATVDAICHAKPGYIEPILCQIRKLIFRKSEQDELAKLTEYASGDTDVPITEEANCLVQFLPCGEIPECIIFRGKKFIPEELLKDKEQSNQELRVKLKDLTGKVQRLETLTSLKESHLVDLTRQLHEAKLKLGEDNICCWSGKGTGPINQ